MALLSPLSQVDRAFNDTLILKAQGYAFDDLADMYGVPRISYIHEKYWRKALQHVAFGPRGAPGSTFAFLREALRGFDKTYQVDVDPSNATKHRITWVAGGPGAGFLFSDLYRFWEIKGEIFFSNGKTAAGAAPWAYIELSKYPGPHWRACDWSQDSSLIAGLPTQFDAVRLPFTCKAYGAIYKVFIENVLEVAPPTYMQVDFNWEIQYQNANPGPFLNWYPSTVDHVGDLEAQTVPYTGKFPLTWAPTPESQWVVEYPTTLNRLDFFGDRDASALPARGGNYVATLLINGAPTAMTATLGAAATHAFVNINVPTVVGDVLSIQISSGAGVNQPLIRPTIQVHGARPVGQPYGGQLLNTAADAGNQTTGPFPLYLNDSGVASWNYTLGLLLAAGVVPEVVAFNFDTPW